MGILVSDLFSEYEEDNFQFGRYTVNIKYRSEQMTPAVLKHTVYLQSLERRQQELHRNPQLLTEALQAVSAMIADLLIEWDLMLEEGVMYPITRDDLAKLDMRFLFETLSAIRGGGSLGEAQPGETTSGSLSDTSPRQAQQASVQNGIHILSPQNGSTAHPGNSSPDLRHSRKNGQRRRSSR